MNLQQSHDVLAVGTGETGANNFLNSSLGHAVVGLCGALGVVIAIVGILGMVRNLTRGRPGDSFKILIFGLMIGGLLFDLNLTITGVKDVGSLIGKAFDSFGSITG